MKRFETKLSIKQITQKIQGELFLANDVELCAVSELHEADEHTLCFIQDETFLKEAAECKAGLIFVKSGFDLEALKDKNIFVTSEPYLYFMLTVRNWLAINSKAAKPEVSPQAVIAQGVVIGKNVSIEQGVVINKNTVIGNNTVIKANTVIKENTVIGKDCFINSNVVIYSDTRIGDNVIIHAGAVIGADGFGYLPYNGIQEKIPQVGNVVIESDVEIGANTAIDRATLGSTFIGKGTKIDNLVQIGHNCKIGENCVICAQNGLAGSTVVKDGVYLAGQVGVAGHLQIGEGAIIGAKSGITKDVPPGSKMFGVPATDAAVQKRMLVALRALPAALKKIKTEGR